MHHQSSDKPSDSDKLAGRLDPYSTIIIAVVCCLAFHGYEVSNFTLSIDEESAISNLFFIQQGRWGEAVRHWLLIPNSSINIPLAPLATGLTFYSVAFVLFLQLVRVKYWENSGCCCTILLRLSRPPVYFRVQ